MERFQNNPILISEEGDGYEDRRITSLEGQHFMGHTALGNRVSSPYQFSMSALQRFHFITRSFIMGEIGSTITALFILYFGTIDVIKSFIIGILVFVFCLVITRLFDAQITKATNKIIGFLAGHGTVRDFILNHF